MAFDAVILAGGRSSRLGGTPKATLLVEGRSLLARTLDAVSGARVRIVVGDRAPGLPDDVIVTRESPAYGGPVAALGAGLAQLPAPDDAGEPAFILVLACDMPGIGAAVNDLLDAAEADPDADAVVVVDGNGVRQHLAAVFRRDCLSGAVSRSPLAGVSMRRVFEGMKVTELPVAPGVCDDVDTWTDAERLGAQASDQERSIP